jgi:hypothetical protein
VDDTQKAQAIARLETLGESQVRLLLKTGGLPPSWNLTIIKWLTEKDQETQRRKEQSQNEQYQIALSSKRAAWIAAYAAIAATVIAIIGVVVTWLAWKWPHP